MEHKTIEYLTKIARVHPERAEKHGLLRRERLYRFAEILERSGDPVSLLSRVEY